MKNSLSLNQSLLNPNIRVGSDIGAWLSHGGGRALRLASKSPESIIPAVRNSGLAGYGGSGFPTYKKLELTKNSISSVKYLVCNGNEEEPDAVKDEILIRETPYQLIEGAVIIALSCNINTIIFYINKSYKKSISVLEIAIKQFKALDAFANLTTKIEIKIVQSRGTYVSGEETAAIEEIENRFPLPQEKPPYPMEKGINGYPTLVNNIETICNIPHIINFSSSYKLTKLYTLCGDINTPGVFELPLGIHLCDLIKYYGNGVTGDKAFQAVIIGGESCLILSENSKTVTLNYSNTIISLGTAVIRVINDKDKLIHHVHRYLSFYADESCGQCPPCKLGSSSIRNIFDNQAMNNHDDMSLNKLIQLSDILTNSKVL